MKTILVPTDFSDAAKNAFIYAQHLAKQLSYAIKVVHINRPPVTAVYPLKTSPLFDFERIKRKQINTFLQHNTIRAREQGTTSLMISSQLKIGLIVDEIIHCANQAEIALVVMGTTGASRPSKPYFGSIAARVAGRATCPVLLIPPHTTFKAVKDILLLDTNRNNTNDAVIENLFETALIHRLNVKATAFQQAGFRKAIPISNDSIWHPNLSANDEHLLHTELIGQLNLYEEAKKVQLICLAIPKTALIDRLLLKGPQKIIQALSNYPLLIICNSNT